MTDASFNFEPGLPVVDRGGEEIGRVEDVFAEKGTDLDRFLVVGGRLVPTEVVESVKGGVVHLNVMEEHIEKLPAVRGPPSGEDVQRAYDAVGLEPPRRGPK